jgi:hypothetical protein
MGALALLKLIPTSVWVGLGAFVVASLALFALDHAAYNRGASAVQVKWDVERVQMQAALEREKQRQAQVVEKTVTEYRDRIKVVKEKGDAIVQQVPFIVRGECELPGGWRVLHDAAAAGDFPEDSERAIAAAKSVDAVTAARTVASNYAIARENSEKLAALQQLLKNLQ